LAEVLEAERMVRLLLLEILVAQVVVAQKAMVVQVALALLVKVTLEGQYKMVTKVVAVAVEQVLQVVMLLQMTETEIL
jgi:hypothetical protein